ncbi:ComEC/Rec2 family competence protein [candidate division KSB1 bacterium]
MKKKGKQWVDIDEKVLLYFEKDNRIACVKSGSTLLIHSRLNAVESPHNPGEFDYKKYLRFHHIFFKAYIQSGAWYYLEEPDLYNPKNLAYHVREMLINILRKYHFKDEELGIAAAILLGDDNLLDDQLASQYSHTGAMHILCVSGLHVGIIYMVLTYLSGFLKFKNKNHVLHFMLMICCIWIYAFITGLSPSVMRASTMFSFIIAGKTLGRYSNIYNSIAASAFILLAINPFIITEIGFQLSYAAVTGIVLIQREIYKIWIPSNKIADKIWSITSVSLAAQIATFPVSIYYFHQFPVLFIFTNIIVIPLSGIIIYLGLVVFFTSIFYWPGKYFSYILLFSIKILNGTIGFIDHFSFSSIQHINLNLPSMILLFLIEIFFFVFLFLKRSGYLIMFLVFSIIFLLYLSNQKMDQINQSEFIVNKISKSSSFQFIRGKSCLLVGDSMLFNDNRKQDFYLRNYWINKGIKKIDLYCLNDHKAIIKQITNAYYLDKPFFAFTDKKFLFIDKTFKFPKLSKRIKIDYLIISDGVKIKTNQIMEIFDVGMVIIDSSNPRWYVEDKIKEFQLFDIHYYSVIHSGAFQIKM